MSIANQALPIKMRGSIYALQKLSNGGRKNLLATGALLAFEEATRKGCA